MLTFGQWVFRRHFPVAVFTHDCGADHFIVDNQLNGFSRHGAAAAEYRLGIIGGIAIVNGASDRADVVFHITNDRFRRRRQVDDKLDRIGWLAGVARRIGDNHYRFVLAFRQWVFRRHFPVAVFAHDCGTHNFVVDNQFNGVARLSAFATKNRQGIIGGVTIVNRASDRTDVIFHLTNYRFFRRRQVDDKIDRIGRLADVTLRVGDHHHRFMFAFRQGFFWRDFPVAVFTYNRCAHDFIVDNQFNGFTRVRATATENRLGVVSGFAVADRASDWADVILNLADRRFARAIRWRGNHVAVTVTVVTATVMTNNGANTNCRTNRG